MFLEEPLPERGYITLSTKPGFGLELNRAALNLQRPFTHAVERPLADASAAGGSDGRKKRKQ